MMASNEGDIHRRLGLAWGAFKQLEKICKAKHVPTKLKTGIFKTLVVSILLCGCEAWIISPRLSSKINSFGTSCLRRIVRMQRLYKITNIEVNRRTDEKPLMNQVRKRQLGWLGHVLRRPAKFESSRTFALYEPTHGSAKRGRNAF